MPQQEMPPSGLDCLSCRTCCRNSEPFIFLTPEEQTIFPHEGGFLPRDAEGFCIYYNLATAHCRLYGQRRPLHCEVYPVVNVDRTLILDSGCPRRGYMTKAAVAHAVTLYRQHPDLRLPEEPLAPTEVRFEDYDSLKPLRAQWDAFHKGSREVTADYDLCKSLESLAKLKDLPYRVRVFYHGDQVVGLLPMAIHALERPNDWNYAFGPWFMSPRFPVDPTFLPAVLKQIPAPFFLLDNTFRYGVGPATGQFAANVVVLPRSFEDYRSNMRAKSRKAFKFLLRDNADLSVRIGWTNALWRAMAACAAHWDTVSADDGAWVRYQHDGYRIVYTHAWLTGRLFPVTVWQGDTLVAATMNVIDGDTLALYEVYRDFGAEWHKRGVGNFALLKTIEAVINLHPEIRFYDLSRTDVQFVEEMGYKRRFVNSDFKTPLVAVCSTLEQVSCVAPPYVFEGELYAFDDIVVGAL